MKQDTDLKDEKSGKENKPDAAASRGEMQQALDDVNYILTGEKAGEEKEKDKEKRDDTPKATEATDAKEKSEAADVKKGSSDALCGHCAAVKHKRP